MKKCNGTGLVLKICETKNNVWKKYEISIQDSIDNHIETTKIKPNFASLNNTQEPRNVEFTAFLAHFLLRDNRMTIILKIIYYIAKNQICSFVD